MADKDILSSKASVKVPEKKVIDEVSEIDVSFTKDAGEGAGKAKTEAENALLDNPGNVTETFLCNHCDYQVKCQVLLRKHKDKEHKLIPQ